MGADYVIERKLSSDYQTTVARVKEALAREGFGVLTEIDLKAKLKEKLGVDFKDYVILGACHPPSAYKAVLAEESIGVLLPCNVVVHSAEGGTIVKAVRPTASLGIVKNPALEPLGREVEAMLTRVVQSLGGAVVALAVTFFLAGPAVCAAGSAADSTKSQGKSKAKRSEVRVEPKTAVTMPVKPSVEPTHIQVQHILIGFQGSIPGKKITRTKEQAKDLAYKILELARKAEDFDALVRQYTDDSPPGIYGMSGKGFAPAQGEYARDRMVPAFGNVGFAISPGNIGIADYDSLASPYGWHIIKRLK